MKVVFLGVGEACDETSPNTSVLLQTVIDGEPRSMLFDCGFTVPSQYWRQTADPNELDGLWISHFHGDHFFGLPALLLRFWETKRRKPLVILGQTGIQDLVYKTMELAYPGFLGKLTYSLEFVSVEPDDGEQRVLGFRCRFAENGHGQRDLAVRVDDGRRSVFYSGDGVSTDRTLSLAGGCHLLIHEAFDLQESVPGHGTIDGCIEFARKARTGILALVHIQRDVRREHYEQILRVVESVDDFHVLLPEPGDVVEL